MSRSSSARRIGTAALYGGGGLVGVGAAVAGVLIAEGFWARHSIGIRKESAPYADGIYGPRKPGTSIRLVMMGDSSAAGLGADSPLETPGALIAEGIADAADRPVRFVNVATVGARSADLDGQVTRALLLKPHVVVILIGGNDVTHLTRPQTAVRDLENAVSRLVDAGAEVVVGTCPDIGSIKPIRPPLRTVARRLSRQLAAAQTIGVLEGGGRSVSLGSLLGPEFSKYPTYMFAHDRFHPSAAGYAAAAQVLLPSVLDSLGLAPTDEEVPNRGRGDALLPVAVAAVNAADISGTEVASGRVGAGDRGPRGPWAQLRRRILRPLKAAEDPDPLSAEPEPAGEVAGNG